MKLKVLLFLLSTSIGLLPCTNATVITSTEILDLELISRNTGEVGGVLPVIDRTITQAGKERFATILCNPITDIKILQARQQLIQSMQNPAFAAKIRQQLETIKKHEPMLRLCFDPTYREQFSAALEKSYYKLEALQKLNKSPLALDAAHIVEFIALFEPVLHHALLHAGLDFITGEHSCGSCAGHNHNHDHSADHQTCSHAHDDNKFANFMRESALGKLLQNTLIYGHGAMTLLNVKEMAEHLYYKSGIINVIHQELISVNACIKACATIGDIFKNDLINHAHIDADILPLLCDDYTELVAQSFDGTFQDTEENYLGLFSRVGPTLAKYKELGDQTTLINNIMHAAGSIDALLSVATLLTEKPEQYSFAHYQEGITPFIKLDNFIHPQLGTNGIQNNIILSKDAQTDKMIITGPNKAGKSSITKAIVVNLVLAQTVGIAAATNAVITPIHRIITYVNIHDNLSENASMFLTEIMRADRTLVELSALNGNAPSIALFDDSLFRSTQPAEGEQAAYRFIKKICDLDSTIALVVTHFEQLTKLEDETHGSVRNYHIGLDTDSAGNVISTYHLKPGISPRDAIFSIVANETYQSDLLQAVAH